MASAFESAARNVVQELGRHKELIPVDSLNSSSRFTPYSLLRKKTRSSLFWRSQYVCLNLTLKDILDPSSPEPEVTQLGPFHFNIEVDGQVSASMEVTSSVQGKISGQISESNRTILEVKTLSVSPTTWDCLKKERKLKAPEPSLIQELRKKEKDLFVVTEAVKTQEKAILKDSRNREGAGLISIPGASRVQGQGHLNTLKTVTVPEGSILGFQVAKLIIRDHWEVLLLPDKKQKTFPPKAKSIYIQASCCSDEDMLSVLKEGFEEDTNPDFDQLQAEVEREKCLLTMLDEKQRQSLLQGLLGLLQNEQNLLDLEDMVEESLYTGVPLQKMEGMTYNILRNLQFRNGIFVEKLAGPFLYLLGALNALNDSQHRLLIQLLEKKEKILSQERDLVKGILKENFNQTEERPSSLPSELLSFVQGQDENLTLIHNLLEECGLKITGDEPQFTWNPRALHSLCALYGSLVLLQALYL